MSCKRKIEKDVSFETFLMDCTSMDSNVCSVIASFFVLLEIKSEFQTVGAIGSITENIKEFQFPSVDIIPYQSFIGEKDFMIIRYQKHSCLDQKFEEIVEVKEKAVFTQFPSTLGPHKLNRIEWNDMDDRVGGLNYCNVDDQGQIISIRMSAYMKCRNPRASSIHVCGNLMIYYDSEYCCLCGVVLEIDQPVRSFEHLMYELKTLDLANPMRTCLQCTKTHGFGTNYDMNEHIFKSLNREYGTAFL